MFNKPIAENTLNPALNSTLTNMITKKNGLNKDLNNIKSKTIQEYKK